MSFRSYGYVSGGVIILAEIYHLIDREWMAYNFLQNFLFVEILSTIVSFTLGDGKIRDTLWTKLCLYVELAGLVFGICASYATGHAMTSCINLDDETVNSATNCIETYSSYAAVDGPMGVNNVCASLDENTESPLGGVCDNIIHENFGTALLALQFTFVLILTLMHVLKWRMCVTDTKSENTSTGNDDEEKVIAEMVNSAPHHPTSPSIRFLVYQRPKKIIILLDVY